MVPRLRKTGPHDTFNGLAGHHNDHQSQDRHSSTSVSESARDNPPVPVPVPIAIVGLGMRLPGGCNDADTFWDFLMDKKEGMIPIPSSRWNLDGFHDPTGRPGTIKARQGNFLDLDPGAFDGNFWSLTAAQVEQVDPQHRILLETVYEAVENAGEKNVRGRRVGVYVGLFAEVINVVDSD